MFSFTSRASVTNIKTICFYQCLPYSRLKWRNIESLDDTDFLPFCTNRPFLSLSTLSSNFIPVSIWSCLFFLQWILNSLCCVFRYCSLPSSISQERTRRRRNCTDGMNINCRWDWRRARKARQTTRTVLREEWQLLKNEQENNLTNKRVIRWREKTERVNRTRESESKRVEGKWMTAKSNEFKRDLSVANQVTSTRFSSCFSLSLSALQWNAVSFSLTFWSLFFTPLFPYTVVWNYGNEFRTNSVKILLLLFLIELHCLRMWIKSCTSLLLEYFNCTQLTFIDCCQHLLVKKVRIRIFNVSRRCIIVR